MTEVNSYESCFTWLAGNTLPGNNRAALAKEAKWKEGETISVSFLDGVKSVQDRIKDVVQQWTVANETANLKFAFRNENDTLIRISFRYTGSWSVLGTTCKQITDLSQPTMNYGWLDESSSDEALQRVVLHEFGHALGLIHEHQHPTNDIQWNKEEVRKELSGPPNNWTDDVIEHNLYKPHSAKDTNYSKFDPTSIMMYPIKKNWTLNGYSFGINSTLSETDKEFIRKEYPW